jgi:hypothetical protein
VSRRGAITARLDVLIRRGERRWIDVVDDQDVLVLRRLLQKMPDVPERQVLPVTIRRSAAGRSVMTSSGSPLPQV